MSKSSQAKERLKNNQAKQKKPPKRKNVSQKILNGRTVQTRDEFLSNGNLAKDIKPDHPKENDLYRRAVVIDSNKNNELVLTVLKSHGKHNLKNYKNGDSCYNAYVEVKDNNGRRIKIDGKRFKINSHKLDVPIEYVIEIKQNCFSNNETSRRLKLQNRNKVRVLKKRIPIKIKNINTKKTNKKHT